MNPIKTSVRRLASFFLRQFGPAGTGLLLAFGSIAASKPSEDLEQCRQNLATVFSAIQEYRKVHHRLPDRLQDLVPKQLPDAALLQCPVGRQTSNPGVLPVGSNKVAAAAYVYEFEPTPLTNSLSRGLGMTLRSWRQLQMGKIGADVPMVRCTNHVHELSLSFGGEIRESGPEWEDGFATVVRPEDLKLESLLTEQVHLKVVRIPAREPGTPPELVDLTCYYNGALTGWIGDGKENSLADFKTGRTLIDGVSFDARGVIQLGSLNYPMCGWPTNVLGVAVGLRCEGLIFLHGTVNGEAEDYPVGQYTVHFEDGSTNVLPIAYGVHVLDWRESDRLLENGQKGWASGRVSCAVQKNGARLYVCHWTNPQPNLRIQTIDFVSRMTQSSPFLVAITAELTKEAKNDH